MRTIIVASLILLSGCERKPDELKFKTQLRAKLQQQGFTDIHLRIDRSYEDITVDLNAERLVGNKRYLWKSLCNPCQDLGATCWGPTGEIVFAIRYSKDNEVQHTKATNQELAQIESNTEAVVMAIKDSYATSTR